MKIHVEELNKEINVYELYAILRKIKSGKTFGIDGLPIEFLILLVDLYNTSTLLVEGAILKRWCMGIIIPILKSGDKLEVNNYRGNTLATI